VLPDGPAAAEVPKPAHADRASYERLVASVHRRIRHVEAPYRVPVTENWVLAGLGLFGGRWSNYEFTDPDRGLARGAGICTQYAYVVFGLLERAGIPRRIVLLRGHAVVEARSADGRSYVLDADFGTVVPGTVDELRRDPRRVRAAYARLDPRTTPFPDKSSAFVVREVERAYGSAVVYTSSSRAAPSRVTFEAVAYVLKWLVPVLLAVVAAAALARSQVRSAAREAPALSTLGDAGSAQPSRS
jgi:hypothetical protein